MEREIRIKHVPESGRVRISLPNGGCRLLAGNKHSCLSIITSGSFTSSFTFDCFSFAYLFRDTITDAEQRGLDYPIEWL